MQEGSLPQCWENSPTYFTTESAQVGAPVHFRWFWSGVARNASLAEYAADASEC